MSLVEEAGAVQQIAQARAFEAMFSPLDLRRRAAPGLAFEDRPVALCEFPIEAGIVRDDDRGIGNERGDRSLVDSLSPASLADLTALRAASVHLPMRTAPPLKGLDWPAAKACGVRRSAGCPA